MKIKNIEDVRNYMIESLKRLEDGEIDVTEAGIIAKGAETIMSSIKLQLQYHHMRGEQPTIPFIHDCRNGTALIEVPHDKATGEIDWSPA